MTPLTDAVRERLTDKKCGDAANALLTHYNPGHCSARQWEIGLASMRESILAAIAPVLEQAQRELAYLKRECQIRDLAVPLEEELYGRIDEMCKHLLTEQGFTYAGIGQLLVKCQERMAADWIEIGRLRLQVKEQAQRELAMQPRLIDGHEPNCPAIQAWDIPGACQCDRGQGQAQREARNPLMAELFDLITLMPDSQTQALIDYIGQLRAARGQAQGAQTPEPCGCEIYQTCEKCQPPADPGGGS